jgi:hypothetical protein
MHTLCRTKRIRCDRGYRLADESKVGKAQRMLASTINIPVRGAGAMTARAFTKASAGECVRVRRGRKTYVLMMEDELQRQHDSKWSAIRKGLQAIEASGGEAMLDLILSQVQPSKAELAAIVSRCKAGAKEWREDTSEVF